MSQGIRRAPFPTFFRLSSPVTKTGGDAHTSAVFVVLSTHIQMGTFHFTVLLVSICQRSFFHSRNCGEYRIRTDDLLRAMQAL